MAMRHHKVWFIGIGGIALVWAVALGGIAIARHLSVTPEKIATYIESHPIKDRTPDERMAIVKNLGEQVNRLSFEQREVLRDNRSLWKTYEAMTDEERKTYLDLTLSTGMKQMMNAFNAMPRERRQQLVDDALHRMKQNKNPTTKVEIDKRIANDTTKRIIDEGMKAFMTDASASSKIELQPLIEQIQRLLQQVEHP